MSLKLRCDVTLGEAKKDGKNLGWTTHTHRTRRDIAADADGSLKRPVVPTSDQRANRLMSLSLASVSLATMCLSRFKSFDRKLILQFLSYQGSSRAIDEEVGQI